MPSSTFASYELINVGPLTTTFTAPPSCETASIPSLALSSLPFLPYVAEWCVPYSSQGPCVPSGAEIDAISTTKGQLLVGFGWAMPYFSPGLHCPDGYTTAGVAEMSANGESSVTGIFSASTFIRGKRENGVWEETVITEPAMLPGVNVVASALEEGETAVICCKSGYTIDPLIGCYSNPPATSYTDFAVCQQLPLLALSRDIVNTIFTYNGKVFTKKAFEHVNMNYMSSLAWTTKMLNLRNSHFHPWTDHLTGYTSVQMITLIHRGAQDHPATETAGNEAAAQTGSAEQVENMGVKDLGSPASSPRLLVLLVLGLTGSTLACGLGYY